MKFFLIILGYILPGIFATFFITILDKYELVEKTSNLFKKFDSKNSGIIYETFKSIVILIIFLITKKNPMLNLILKD